MPEFVPRPRLLVLDDDQLIRDSFKTDATKNRWSMLPCTTIEEAQTLCKQLEERGERLDMVLVDRGVIGHSQYNAAQVLGFFRPYADKLGLITGWNVSDTELNFAESKLHVPIWNKNEVMSEDPEKKGFFLLVERTLKWHQERGFVDPEVGGSR